MFKNVDTPVDADKVCGEAENPGPAKDEPDLLAVGDSSSVFDLAEMTKFSQVVRKSFSD
ncbi:TPA: hypothetical protein LC218_004254 [Salmonella enterica subsp. arizonae serovar 13,22:z4,z23:-]|uniref:Uncharacterized protein n=1 Tax=Salmonella enterica subsp. arizonae TaxID=59203 RepID=A0A379S6Z1_SALER|nr:hypothetical protein [Salmonella enterica]SUG16573.1 Uncharacterised protein [Salmonella enterica subsp. arizonae]HBJ6282105.1 hypothetical protein [Salmonella enterica subsp. arizonae serovar 13,22:z4,z23:-]EEF7847681.1 hypothetical protein [Salmonella enterica]EEN0023299.1 hypothetical protein [Salmonella enterica]